VSQLAVQILNQTKRIVNDFKILLLRDRANNLKWDQVNTQHVIDSTREFYELKKYFHTDIEEMPEDISKYLV